MVDMDDSTYETAERSWTNPGFVQADNNWEFTPANGNAASVKAYAG